MAAKIVNAIGWSAIERFALQGTQFIIQIIMARLLLPSDYGIIGMLAIFLHLSQVITDSGFGNALIQKQGCTDKDYSTVFYYNLTISIVFYIILYTTSPAIARFYNLPIIVDVLRVIAISLIINALFLIHKTILIKHVDFKTQSKISLAAALLSGTGGIILAYNNYGVWALCWQTLLNSILQLFLYVYFVRWKLSWTFDRLSFRSLFKFGSKVLGANIISALYTNLYTLVIGKKFSADDLGYYTRADQFARFPSNNIGNIISRVAYPVLSKFQNDDSTLLNYYRQLIRYSSFIIFPLMFGLLAVAGPFINSVLTSKWDSTVIILQILCLDWMLDHLSLLNLNILYVKGRSDLVLKLEIIKKIIAVTVLVITVNFGILALCWGKVLYGIIAVFLNSYYTKQLVGLSIWEQLKDIIPYYFSSALMAFIVICSTKLFASPYLQLSIGILTGIFVYTTITLVFFKDIVIAFKSKLNIK